ncbi:hypothetical protein L195_g064540, partial [Trifolium pratense]
MSNGVIRLASEVVCERAIQVQIQPVHIQ